MARPARLSRDRIVQAALALADEVGTEGLSMRALARRLGADPMAVYRHVSGKDDLLGAMCDAVLADLPDVSGAGGWEAAVVELTDALVEALVRRPALIPVLAGAPATPAAVALTARALRVLVDAGADEATASAAWALLFTSALGHAATATSYVPPGDPAALAAATEPLFADPRDAALLPAAMRLVDAPGDFGAARDLAVAAIRQTVSQGGGPPG